MTRKIKVSVNLTEEEINLIQEVGETTGRNVTDVIRHALGLESVAQRVRINGGKMLVEEPNQKYYQILIQ